MDLFRSTVFCFSAKVAIIQNFLFSLLLVSSSPLFLFLLSSSIATVILELIGPKKPSFLGLFKQMTAKFVRLFFTKSARYR